MGARVPSLLISPWVPKGKVIHSPQGPAPNSAYEHSSVPATLKDIFDLPSFLTKRDAWAGSFLSELSLKEPRTDTPTHLPTAPPPTLWQDDDDDDDDDDGGGGDGHPSTMGGGGGFAGAERNGPIRKSRRLGLTNSKMPRHCSYLGTPFKCGDPSRAHKKQKQRMKQWIQLNNVVDPPNPETVNRKEADEFINEQFQHYHRRILEDGGTEL